jgi:hypothetical protein
MADALDENIRAVQAVEDQVRPEWMRARLVAQLSA